MADTKRRKAARPRPSSRASTHAEAQAVDDPVLVGDTAASEPDLVSELQDELQAAHARFAELEQETRDLRKKLKAAEDYGDAITIERDKALSALENMEDERDGLRERLHMAIENAKAMEAKVDAYELCLASAQLIPRRDP